jgi:alpha-beta hydrolase superfamily lysophospholipase
VRVPVLILQGATDQQVTPEQAEVLGKTMRDAGNRQVTVRVFPQANHLFVQDPDGNPANYAKLPSGMVRADVLRELTAWAVKTMRTKQSAM